MICKLCSAASHLKFNIKGYLQHIRLFHAHQADFRIVCGIGGCLRSFTNFGTFTNHVYSVHGGSSNKADCEVAPQNDGTQNEDHEDESCDYNNHATDEYDSEQPTNHVDHQPCFTREMLQKSSATFLLGLKEKFKLTQTSVQGIIQGVTALNNQNMNAMKTQVCTIFDVIF